MTTQQDLELFKKLREYMKENNTEGIKEVTELLEKKGYNVPQENITSEYDIVLGQKIIITPSCPDDESDHHEPFEDDGSYAEDSNED